MGGYVANAQVDAQRVHRVRHLCLLNPVSIQRNSRSRAVVAGVSLVFPHFELASRDVDHIAIVRPEHGGPGVWFSKHHWVFGRCDRRIRCCGQIPGGQHGNRSLYRFERGKVGRQVASRQQQY